MNAPEATRTPPDLESHLAVPAILEISGAVADAAAANNQFQNPSTAGGFSELAAESSAADTKEEDDVSSTLEQSLPVGEEFTVDVSVLDSPRLDVSSN